MFLLDSAYPPPCDDMGGAILSLYSDASSFSQTQGYKRPYESLRKFSLLNLIRLILVAIDDPPKYEGGVQILV